MMKKYFSIRNLFAFLLLPAIYQFVAVQCAYADTDAQELEHILEQVRIGEILPLELILRSMYAAFSGEVISVDLERDDGLIVYEIKLITTTGRLIEIYLDAKTGEIIKVENDS